MNYYRYLTLACCMPLMLSVRSGYSQPTPTQADARPIPVEDFTRRPRIANLQISPDGRRFAAREEFKGRMNLVVGSLVGGAMTRVTGYEKEGDVAGFAWATEGDLVYFLADYKSGLAEQRGGGLFTVAADGTSGKELSPTAEGCFTPTKLNYACRHVSFWSRIPGSDREIVVLSNERSARSPDLYRLDIRSGRKTLITTENPGRVSLWVLDNNLAPRAAVSVDGKRGESTFLYRDRLQDSWRSILTWRIGETSMTPIAFGGDGTLYVSSNRKTDTRAIYKFDAKVGLEGDRMAFHPTADIGWARPSDVTIGAPESPLLFDPVTDELIGVAIEADRREVYWLREQEQKVQATLDAALSGAENRFRRLPDGRWFVVSRSDRDPGTYYILDPAKRQLLELGRPRGWIRPAQMSRTEVIRYTARDGLEIPGYLTVPVGKSPKNLPLIAWVHGGPWARDDWGWNSEVQFFASRGYAVFQPNYRGSEGFGHKHFVSGFKQLGRAMQDDITDGVRHLIDRGTVDPGRVCIGGGSYGGYATMMGLVKEPNLFRCGINVVGVTDLSWWVDLGYTDFNTFDAEASFTYLAQTVGDPSVDGEMMRANSPRLQAHRIKAPVLFVHGAGDVRVPIAHAEGMRDAMQSRALTYEWVVYPEEGHGFLKEANRTDYLRKMEAFLQRHIGAP